MMKLPTLFGKIPKHQRFNYGPRYYDPVKDEREARHRAQNLSDEETGEGPDLRKRMSGAFQTARRHSKVTNSELRAVIIRLAVLLFLTLMIIGWLQWGGQVIYFGLLAIPVYLYFKFLKK
jgi:hypothetical protein